jgi:hypothetical protein
MILEVTYNKTTGNIKFVDSDIYTDLSVYQLQLWKFTHSENSLMSEGIVGSQELEFHFEEDEAYRVFVVRTNILTGAQVEVSEVFTQLHTFNSYGYIKKTLAAATKNEYLFDAVAVIRVHLIEAQLEYSKGNLLGATEALKKIKETYNVLNIN